MKSSHAFAGGADMKSPCPGLVIMRDGASQGVRWLSFSNPKEIVQATSIKDVIPALVQIERAVDRGLFAAGFMTYEAAPAFDPAFAVHPAGALPPLWFGIYDHVEELVDPVVFDGDLAPLPWTATVGRDAHAECIRRIKASIARGDTYQVNFTYRLRAPFSDSAWEMFSSLYQSQQTNHAAFVDLGRHALCSASPELFFDLKGDEITCRPMKGTAPRGLTLEDDQARAAELHESAKDRAENVMIVDMVRNDLGRIALTGSVEVLRLFDVQRYNTLWQMTSTVAARTCASIPEIFAALFPCASVTGAPKIETMRIIRALESTPRGIYTGCIGYLAPGRRASFNVAIRTVHVNRVSGIAEYGVGGGIVWDSTDTGEYQESLTKALVLSRPKEPAFSLLETLLWTPLHGYFLLDLHLQRLARSALYFGFPLEEAAVLRQLHEVSREWTSGRWRVRLLVDGRGVPTTQAAPLVARTARRRWSVALARAPIDRRNKFLYHKTTHREVYEQASDGLAKCDDVILWNSAGEITEATLANVVIRKGRELITPPVHSGLLPGIYRAHLLAQGRIREGVVTLDALRAADRVYLINSVRGWIPACLIAQSGPP